MNILLLIISHTGEVNFYLFCDSTNSNTLLMQTFNYNTNRIPEDSMPQLDFEQGIGASMEDAVDLFCYRQLHSAIITPNPLKRRTLDLDEFGNLLVASCLKPCPFSDCNGASMFKSPSGFEVETKEEVVRAGLEKLYAIWPRGIRVAEAFPNVTRVMDDLKLLQRNGLIELRCIEPGDFGVDGNVLNILERTWAGYFTTPYHTMETIQNIPVESHSAKC
jgi:hypothetical protein